MIQKSQERVYSDRMFDLRYEGRAGFYQEKENEGRWKRKASQRINMCKDTGAGKCMGHLEH